MVLEVLTMVQRQPRTKRLSSDGDPENASPVAKKMKRSSRVQAQAEEEDASTGFVFKRVLRPRKSIQAAANDSMLEIQSQAPQLEKRAVGSRRTRNSIPIREHHEEEPLGERRPTTRRKADRTIKDRVERPLITENGHPTPPSSDRMEKVTLPLSDTPVIRKNREFRKSRTGARRSSMGMRGHRASSLMDSGHSAIPHDKVDESDFHKHIASDLPEPRRMRQLLSWCGARALAQKQSFSASDGHARAVARVIQEELLRDFSDRPELSDWFSREDSHPIQIFKRPNPRNEQNLRKVEECERQLEALEAEQALWKGIMDESSTSLSVPQDPPAITQPEPSVPLPEADLRHLELSESAYLESLYTQDPTRSRIAATRFSSTQARLTELSSKLEFRIDAFADGVHTIGQYQELADQVATQVLSDASKAWSKRERKLKQSTGTEEVSTREVLRKLSRIDYND